MLVVVTRHSTIRTPDNLRAYERSEHPLTTGNINVTHEYQCRSITFHHFGNALLFSSGLR